jgi:transporter family-2 protein
VKLGYALIAVVCGALLATQGWINGQLGLVLGQGVLAAFSSTFSGFVVLVVAVGLTPAGRRGVRRLVAGLRNRQLLWWQCLGGVCGAFFVAGQGLAISSIGVAIFTVAAVSGQLVSGLWVDQAGVGPGEARPVTLWRVLGAGLAVAAVVVALNGYEGKPSAIWLVVFPAVAGFGLAWQSAVNGLVRETAANSFVATLVNFGVAGSVLALAAGADVLVLGDTAGPWPGQWWLYTGGLLGIFVISGAALVVRTIGVLLLGMCMVAGQLLGAVLLDLLVPERGAHLTFASALGTAITLVAVVVAAIPRRSERMAA